MRVALLVLALLILAPTAAAQLPVAPPASAPAQIDAVVGAFAAPASPFKAAVAAPFTARVSCALVAQGGKDGLPVQLVVANKPEWAFASVAPPFAVLSAQQCDASGYITIKGSLTATAAGDAPAFQSAPLSVKISAAPPSGAQAATALTNLTAGYYGALDVAAPQTVATVAPGGSGSFPLTLTNIGNAVTTVNFDVEGGQGVQAAPLEPLTLAPKQTAQLTVHYKAAPGGNARVDRGDPVTVKIETASLKDPQQKGQAPVVNFRVNTLSAPDVQKNSPGTALAGAIVALAAVAVLRRRSR